MQPAAREFEGYPALDPAAIDAPFIRWYLSQPWPVREGGGP